MDADSMRALAAFLGPLLGTGAGVWFGIKGALNGMRADVREMRADVREVRDYSRDTKTLLDQYTREGREAMRKIDRLGETI